MAAVKRNVQVLLLLFLGVGLLHISLLTDLYLRYVREGLRPALIASGVLLIALGAVSAARDGFPFNRPARTAPRTTTTVTVTATRAARRSPGCCMYRP
ncbi:hypothetical protein ACFQ2Y_05535 [Streptomyces malaysiensis subsp. malaysiensis]